MKHEDTENYANIVAKYTIDENIYYIQIFLGEYSYDEQVIINFCNNYANYAHSIMEKKN